jgi:hypothetical protein
MQHLRGRQDLRRRWERQLEDLGVIGVQNDKFWLLFARLEMSLFSEWMLVVKAREKTAVADLSWSIPTRLPPSFTAAQAAVIEEKFHYGPGLPGAVKRPWRLSQ